MQYPVTLLFCDNTYMLICTLCQPADLTCLILNKNYLKIKNVSEANPVYFFLYDFLNFQQLMYVGSFLTSLAEKEPLAEPLVVFQTSPMPFVRKA